MLLRNSIQAAVSVRQCRRLLAIVGFALWTNQEEWGLLLGLKRIALQRFWRFRRELKLNFLNLRWGWRKFALTLFSGAICESLLLHDRTCLRGLLAVFWFLAAVVYAAKFAEQPILPLSSFLCRPHLLIFY